MGSRLRFDLSSKFPPKDTYSSFVKRRVVAVYLIHWPSRSHALALVPGKEGRDFEMVAVSNPMELPVFTQAIPVFGDDCLRCKLALANAAAHGWLRAGSKLQRAIDAVFAAAGVKTSRHMESVIKGMFSLLDRERDYLQCILVSSLDNLDTRADGVTIRSDSDSAVLSMERERIWRAVVLKAEETGMVFLNSNFSANDVDSVSTDLAMITSRAIGVQWARNAKANKERSAVAAQSRTVPLVEKETSEKPANGVNAAGPTDRGESVLQGSGRAIANKNVC